MAKPQQAVRPAERPLRIVDAQLEIETAHGGGHPHAAGLQAGDSAPCFRLDDVRGAPFALVELLERGPVVLMFYRGTWCSYCHAALDGLVSACPVLVDAGATVLAISPFALLERSSDRGLLDTPFPVLDDPGAAVAQRYGLLRHAPTASQRTFRGDPDRPFDPSSLDPSAMPVPATYLIAPDGRIAFSYVDADYRNRQQSSSLGAMLRALRPGRHRAGIDTALLEKR